MQASSGAHLNQHMVSRAIDSLLRWIKSKRKRQKPLSWMLEEFVYLIVTLKKAPGNPSINPCKILLPHPFCPIVDSARICLFIDDYKKKSSRTLTASLARKKIENEALPVSEVIKLSKLKSCYSSLEAKRDLLCSFDLFFADHRAIPSLTRRLGKPFLKKKKLPIPIDLKDSDWKGQIEQACGSAFLYLGSGTCTTLRIGMFGQSRDRLIENICAAAEGVAALVPKKWENIRSFHLKSLESVALPIYQCLQHNALHIDDSTKGYVSDKSKDEIGQHPIPNQSRQHKKFNRMNNQGVSNDSKSRDEGGIENFLNFLSSRSKVRVGYVR